MTRLCFAVRDAGSLAFCRAGHWRLCFLPADCTGSATRPQRACGGGGRRRRASRAVRSTAISGRSSWSLLAFFIVAKSARR